MLQVDSKTVDEMLEEVDWLATCDDKVEIEDCKEFTLYCIVETVERKESICNCNSDVCILEDK